MVHSLPYTHPVSFPFEIWRPIFRLACVDDGTTGCSLSIACKYFREASAPYRYYSI
ncbi:hypothetical protein FIBSPDRAFT_769676, partial [Athelia psychrophila]